MAAATYMYNTRDLKFVLKEWLDMDKLLSMPAYSEYYDTGDIDSIIDTTFKLCRDKIAPVSDDADKIGVQFKDGKVTTPESYKKAYQAIIEAGLGPASADREAEGHFPNTIGAANSEMLHAACMVLYIFSAVTAAAVPVIQDHGSDFLKEKFLPNMCEGVWGGTMNLTEPGVGSDVAATATKAFPTDEPGIYKIQGNKQFITCADHDLCENFIHLVLARTEGALSGTAGLSLFIVPKYWVNDDGSLGDFNDVVITGLEEKMGIHGSPTCSVAFGESGNCRGYILGNPPDESGKGVGIRQMFVMMNEARLGVGIESLGNSTAAYSYALDYAKQRVQGSKLTGNKNERVRIIEHEDVRRMLMTLKACTEAMRALVLKTSYYLDLSLDSTDAEEREYADGMHQISTPMCKSYCSDTAWQLAAEAVQVFGGYGYCSEYPVERIARDSKILSIWEGTNYIQGLDLVGRKFTMKKGQLLKDWLSLIDKFIADSKGAAGFEREFDVLNKAFEDVNAIVRQIGAYSSEGKGEMTGLYATRVLHASSILYCGQLMLDQALLAQKKLNSGGGDAEFYKGKIASARFYVLNIVPQVAALRRVIEIGDTSAIDISEEAF